MIKKSSQSTIGIIIILFYFAILGSLAIIPIILDKKTDIELIKSIASMLGVPVGVVVAFFFTKGE